MPFYFPIFLNLQDRPCVVIGGETTLVGKVHAMLEAGASLTLIAPETCSDLETLESQGKVQRIRRFYRQGDLAGAFLAVSAERDPKRARLIQADAARHRVLLNVVDAPSECTFIMPSILRQGDLCLAISTSGHAPALAVRLRQRLASLLGPEYARFLEWLGALRRDLPERLPDPERRRHLWYTLVDSDILDLLREDREKEAQERFRAILKAHLKSGDP